MGAAHVIVLRYHEIALKGRNRPFFVRRLSDNVRRATAGLPVGALARASARLLLPLDDLAAWPETRGRLARVFGLANFSLAHEVALGGEPDAALDRLGAAILARLSAVSMSSFRVLTKRADKRFPLPSPEVNRRLGRTIQEATRARVDLDHAALTVAVDILPGRAFFALEKVAGAGGLPVGTSGRVLALLSGGIDSPVAAWRMMRRGCAVVPRSDEPGEGAAHRCRARPLGARGRPAPRRLRRGAAPDRRGDRASAARRSLPADDVPHRRGDRARDGRGGAGDR